MSERTPKNIPADTDYDDQDFLTNKVIERDYAETGNMVGKNPDGEPQDAETGEIERIEFDWSAHQPKAEDLNFDADADQEEEQQSIVDKNQGLSSEQISLNKTSQKKIAKMQSKTITNAYCFIVLAAVKFFCTVDEGKVNIMDARGELDANMIIRSLPLIEHIRNGNEYVRRLEIDEDAREAIQEALEIYLAAKNIQTSPEINLLIAMATPVFQLATEAYRQKRDMKTLINYAKEIHEQKVVETSFLKTELNDAKIENQKTFAKVESQEKELEEMREALSRMNAKDVARSEVNASSEVKRTAGRSAATRKTASKKTETA